MKTLGAGALSLAWFAAAAGAQAVRGTVVDATDHPVSGVVVMMLDSASNVATRALSNARGEFRVAAARAGTYRLRTMRIGYRPTTSDPIALLSGGESERRIVLTGAQVALDTMRVVDRSSCRVTSDSAAAATFAVWEQARTALTAAALTATGRSINATTVTYERTLDSDGRRVTKQSSNVRTDYVSQPWRAASLETLHRTGFVTVANDNSVTYQAPNIDVLLSPVFVEDHCFRLTTDRARPGMIGLAFQPAAERKTTPEIRGTLWVDRRTSELRHLEFRYTNISAEQENAGAGGTVDFARMSNGGWAINRWTIRMPVLEQVVRTQALGGTQNHLAEIQVTGGELVLATTLSARGRDTLWARPPLVLSGTVLDSVSGAPVSNARVSLAGTGLDTTTDARGRFTLPGVLPGTYTLETRTTELELIGAVSQTPVTFVDSSVMLQVRAPSAALLASALCGRPLAADAGLIIGQVFQKSDVPAPKGTEVLAEWEGKRLSARTDSLGLFRLCAVPSKADVTVRAIAAEAQSVPVELRMADQRFQRVALPLTAESGASLAGTITDAQHAPIIGAEIAIPDAAKVAMSSVGGKFRLAGIPAGPHRVLVRRLGYGPLDTTLTFTARDRVDRTIVLTRVTTLDSVIVTDRATEVRLRDFEDNRKLGLGHFFTRDQLEKLSVLRVSSALSQTPGLSFMPSPGGHAMFPLGLHHPPPPCAGNGKPYFDCLDAHGYYHGNEGPIACYAKVYLDTQLINPGRPTPPFDVNSLMIDDIEAIEIYTGVGDLPMKYSGWDTKCGVIVIHTRSSKR